MLAESALIAPGWPFSPSSRSRFERQVAFPVATLVALAMLAIIVFVAYSTARQSRDAQDQAARATRHALETKAEEVARTAQDYAWWNDAVRNLDLEFDVTWADNNVGRYIHETFGYDVTFVIGRDDRTRYATIDGELRTADAFELAPGLEHLIARARAISPDQPGAVSAYLMLDGVIAIFGASPITPETTDPIAVPLGPRPVLVYAELLDGDGVLNSIAETLRLHNLHVLPPQAASAATLPLTAPDGTKLGGLAWQPPPLGRELVVQISPPAPYYFNDLAVAPVWCLARFCTEVCYRLQERRRPGAPPPVVGEVVGPPHLQGVGLVDPDELGLVERLRDVVLGVRHRARRRRALR